MKCPNCKTVNLIISERKNVEIDHCPDCRGIWLDKGELDKIIELSVSIPSQDMQNSNDHHKDYDDDNKYNKKRKKESFLADLFDF